MKKYFSWMLESNRPKHMFAGFLIAMFCGVITTIVAALSVEYKDWAYRGCNGAPVAKNGFDWLDVLATVIGGLIVAIGYAVDGCAFSSPFTGLF